MSKRTVPDIKELFKQASAIAQQVPENLQEAAFNRAVDLLTNDAQREHPVVGPSSTNKSASKKKDHQVAVAKENASADLMSQIDSTQHPGIRSATKVLERALMVLEISLNDHGVDGLSANKIAEILTKKFRISTKTNAVNMALIRALHLVDQVPYGQGSMFKIMAPGEDYLSHLGECQEASSPPSKPLIKKSATKKTSNVNKPTKSKAKIKKISSRRTSTIGPKEAVYNLIESGFFSSPRTGPAVKNHLQQKRGFTIGIDQLRLVMLRMVRDEKLDRDKNKEGQYEYKTPGA